MRRRSGFWSGFAAGAASGVGTMLAWNVLASARNRRVLRLERSLQIAAPVHDIFQAWTQFEQFPALSEAVRSVETYGRRSRWVVTLDGKDFEWDAELTQFIPNQAIGWKSVRGPKHTGRVTFSPVGDDTVVHVTMNYAPPLGIFSRTLAPLSEHLEDHVDQTLREFKAAFEGKGQESRLSDVRATGTFGSPRTETQTTRFGGVQQAEEQQRPVQPAPFAQPDAKR
jgi:uncharacterized membrane protein